MTDTPQAPLDLDQFEGHTENLRVAITNGAILILPENGRPVAELWRRGDTVTEAINATLFAAAPRLLAEVRELRAKVAEATARAEAAERQRDELLDAILAQAKRSIASIPHRIWATAIKISKERNAQKENALALEAATATATGPRKPPTLPQTEVKST